MLILANFEDYSARIMASMMRRKAECQDQSALAASLKAASDSDSSYSTFGSDALISVSGPVSYRYDWYCYMYGGASYQGLQRTIADASNNPDVKRIVMLFDTPGGDVVGCRETARMIAQCSKPIVSVVDPTCASAGLWLASQTNHITCMESGSIGSLGVQTAAVSYAKMYEQMGVDIKLIRAAISPNKNLGHPYDPMDDKAIAERQARADKWGEYFLSDVATGRKVTREKALEVFGQGSMLFADEALAVGLIDAIGTLSDVLSAEPAKTAKTTAKYRTNR